MCSSLGYPAGRLCTEQPDLLDPGNASLKQDQSDGAVPSNQLIRAFEISQAVHRGRTQDRSAGTFSIPASSLCISSTCSSFSTTFLSALRRAQLVCSASSRYRDTVLYKGTESPQCPPSTAPEPCCALGSWLEGFAEDKQPGMFLREVLCQAPQLQSTSKE